MGLDRVTISPLVARIRVGRPPSAPEVPERNTPGADGRIVKLKLSLTPPGVCNTTVALPSTLNGNCPLIWLEETNTRLTATPFTVRHDSPSAVGSGVSFDAALIGLNWVPNRLMRPPAAT